MTEDVSGFWAELETARVAAASSKPIMAHAGERVVTPEQMEQSKQTPPDAETESD